MADAIEKTPIADGEPDHRLEALPSAVDDAGALPKGTIDPVYEAKARVLNHAVSTWLERELSENRTEHILDPRDWHGMVSMAAVHCRRLWLGKRQHVANRHKSHLYVHPHTLPRFRFIIHVHAELASSYTDTSQSHLSLTNSILLGLPF